MLQLFRNWISFRVSVQEISENVDSTLLNIITDVAYRKVQIPFTNSVFLKTNLFISCLSLHNWARTTHMSVRRTIMISLFERSHHTLLYVNGCQDTDDMVITHNTTYGSKFMRGKIHKDLEKANMTVHLLSSLIDRERHVNFLNI